MTSTNINKDAGFTLVEIMVALFILSVGIMGVTGMFITTIKANAFARNTTVANRLAQNLIEMVKTGSVSTGINTMCSTGTGITNCVPTTDKNVGVFRQTTSLGNLNLVTYNITMEQARNSPIATLDTVTVTVSWSDSYGPHTTRVITYIEQ